MADQPNENDLLDYARAGEIEPFKELFAQPNGVEKYLACKDEFTHATPLHMAAANGHHEVLKYIIDHIPKGETLTKAVNAVNDSGNTPMHWAALTGSVESVKLLFAAGADPLQKNLAGIDACYQAESADQDEIANFLCSVVNLNEEPVEEEQSNSV